MEIETVIKNFPMNKPEPRTRQLIHPHGHPGHLEKTREGEQNGIYFRKRVKVDGNDGFRRRSMAREGLCARQGQGRGSHGAVSTGKRSLGGFISP